MNFKAIKLLKIYLITFIILACSTLVFAIMINGKTTNSDYKSAQIIIGSITFFTLGILSGNLHQKKGMLVGFLYSLITLLIISLCLVICDASFNSLIYIKYLIYVITTIIGSILGVNLKKFI